MYSYHSILECYNRLSGVKLSRRSFCFIHKASVAIASLFVTFLCSQKKNKFHCFNVRLKA